MTTTLLLSRTAAAGQLQPPAPARQAAPAPTAGVPPDYTLGIDDVLQIVFWREPDMSGEVVVRPDGKISLPLINEVVAGGRTPDQLRTELMEVAKKFIEEPNVTIVVRQINSRKVFITGSVERPGPYPLGASTTVVQLIATAGGLREFADAKSIRIMRVQDGKSVALRFNYEALAKGMDLQQNIVLRPGDTVLVP